jgi:hypothetical protein
MPQVATEMLQVIPSLLGGVASDVEVLYYHIEMLRLFENLVFPRPDNVVFGRVRHDLQDGLVSCIDVHSVSKLFILL